VKDFFGNVSVKPVVADNVHLAHSALSYASANLVALLGDRVCCVVVNPSGEWGGNAVCSVPRVVGARRHSAFRQGDFTWT
jgi:hypothetical protein